MLFHRKDCLFFASTAAILALLLARLLAISNHYPYYFIHDMDFVTCLDSILIHSGRLPDHVNHPGFGMYLLLTFTEALARRCDIVSVCDLRDLANSLNPLAGVAELTVFIRRHGPFLLTALAGCLWLALALVARSPRWFLMLALLLLASQECLGYHAALVRTDYYSVFFWSGAMLAIALAARARRPPGRCAALFAAGVLMGLSFLTKVQALFYVAALPVFLVLFDSLAGRSKPGAETSGAAAGRAAAWGVVALSAANLIVFRLLLAAARVTVVPRGMAVYTDKYGMTALAFLAIAALAGLLVVQAFLVLRNRAATGVFRRSASFTVMAAGFLAAFGLHLLVFADTATSLKYLFCDTKMVFLRPGYYNLNDPQYSAALNWYFSFSTAALLAYTPAIFAAHAAALFLLALGSLRRWVRVTPGQLGLCAALTLLCAVNLVVGVRFILRDLLWAEILTNFLTLLYFSLLVHRACRFRRAAGALAALCMAAVVAANATHLAALPERIDANYNRLSWEPALFTEQVFPGNQTLYTALICRHYYRETLPVALRQAADAERVRSIADFVFPNQRVTLRNVGIVSERMPVWTANPSFRIAAFPPELRGAIVVDNLRLPLRPHWMLKKDLVRRHSEYLDKFRKAPEQGKLAVLTRNDLQILLFSPPDEPPPSIDGLLVGTDLTMQIRNDGTSLALRGYRVENYSELPLNSLSPRSFFVIRTR